MNIPLQKEAVPQILCYQLYFIVFANILMKLMKKNCQNMLMNMKILPIFCE